MKKILVVFCLLLATRPGLCADRFNRPVVKVSDPKGYQFTKLDDVEYPGLSNSQYDVTCLVYRGTERYYVEISVKNKTAAPVALPMNFVAFDKPGYTVYRTDTMAAARESAAAGGIRFVATPPPYVPPTTNTTINATATTYGDQTQISGTATTTTDNSGQAGANLGNAIGNAIAAHRFYKEQRNEVLFSHFLAAHVQTDADSPIQEGETRVIVVTFEQAKLKKAPFVITLKIGSDTFHFSYKE
jgi:hypothetical protein